jgi:thiol-disulfide isomerase/thioredoxin
MWWFVLKKKKNNVWLPSSRPGCGGVLQRKTACKSSSSSEEAAVVVVPFAQLSSGSLSFVMLLLLSFFVAIAGGANEGDQAAASVCSPPTLLEAILPIKETCPATHHHHHPQDVADEVLLPRVAELNETALEKALDLVHSSNGTYVAVLYYANWCPFSREVRPVYDVLSSVFPTIHHVAVEESSVRPSVLSYYGVHSFPIVFMHNRTSRVRYYGSRTLEAFTYFYQNYTGIIKSASKSQSVKHSDCSIAKLSLNVGTTGVKEVCPYPWAISPQKWLQDDAYLKLAFLFLITRLVCFLLPIVASAWKQH